jgi:para-aminobenzoate synthetase component 1
MRIQVKAFPYCPDTGELFAPLSGRPWSVLLDSGLPASSRGRYDILACNPRVTLTTRGATTEIRRAGTLAVSRDDPLELLRSHMGPKHACSDGLPFCGGAIGYFAYDLGRRFERLPDTALDSLGLPDMAVGIYDQALVVDHEARRTSLVGPAGSFEESGGLLAAAAEGRLHPQVGRFEVTGPVRSNMDAEGYGRRFRRVRNYIENGDCYQVNLARRFSVAARGDPWTAYSLFRRLSPAPFAAYFNTPATCILSASPERFLRVRGAQVETCPIKGTRPRDPDPARDMQLRQALAASPKDRAENLMIVDLLRNDLGRTCATGSVRVPSLFQVASFSNVHHLVSRITGRLASGQDALELLRGCFPGGSVTGAPKIRAMEIIEELEGERRSVYCGSIGYLGFDGALDTNILIRTMIHNGNELRFWAGGAIVFDSRCEEEAAEVEAKASAMCEVAERFRTPSGRAPNGRGGGQLCRVRGW